MKANCEPCVEEKSSLSKLAALEDLARTDRSRLYRFILRRVRDPVESEELAQQAFVEAASGIDRFREESGVRTWLYGIAANLVSNHLRRSPRFRYQFESDDVLEMMVDPGDEPSIQLENQELLGRLQHHLDELPEDMRGTLILVLLDDVSYEQAAQMLDIPVGTVRSRISRGRSILKQSLETEGIR